MKTIKITYLLLFLGAILLASCSEDLLVKYEGGDYIMFSGAAPAGTAAIAHSFVFYPSAKVVDTTSVTVMLLGNPSDVDRRFTLTQVEDVEWKYTYDDLGKKIDSINLNLKQAQPGVHYLPIDEKDCVLEAGKASKEVPLYLLRDTTLMSSAYYLRFRLSTDEPDLNLGDPSELEVRHSVIDQLTIPAFWRENAYGNVVRALGEYSQVKHRFMMDCTGTTWDDAYMRNTAFKSPASANMWRAFFYNELLKVNAEREANSMEPLKDENKVDVTFPAA